LIYQQEEKRREEEKKKKKKMKEVGEENAMKMGMGLKELKKLKTNVKVKLIKIRKENGGIKL